MGNSKGVALSALEEFCMLELWTLQEVSSCSCDSFSWSLFLWKAFEPHVQSEFPHILQWHGHPLLSVVLSQMPVVQYEVFIVGCCMVPVMVFLALLWRNTPPCSQFDN